MLDRLTQRAKKVILSLLPEKPKKSFYEVLAQSVLDSVVKEEGVAQKVIALGPLKVDSKAKVSLYKLIEQAYIEAFELKHPYVGTEHILLALYKNLDLDEYKQVQKKVISTGTYPQSIKRGINTATKTPILDAFGFNLSLAYEQGKLMSLVDRPEVNDVITILLQQQRANALIVGEAGVGKASLVKLLAQKIGDLEVPSSLNMAQVVEFDLTAFINSVVGREGLEVGFSSLHDEIITSGDVILFIPDLQSLFTPAGAGTMPPFASSLFKSYILYSGVQIVASTTPQAYQKFMSEDEDVSEVFSAVRLREPDKKTAHEILTLRAKELEKFHSIKISDDVISEAIRVSDAYIRNKRLPQKAVEVLDKAASLLLTKSTLLPKKLTELKKRKFLLIEALNKSVAKADLENAVAIRKKIRSIDLRLLDYRHVEDKVHLEGDYLYQAVSKELDVPVGNLSLGEENLYKGLDIKLSERVVGQDKAVKALSGALLRSRLGLSSKKRPIGNFLFLGPTGVGKTELAKVLSETVFGKNGLIKLDMSDFSERHTVSRLVGAPPGYIGYNEGGELTEKIARNPYSVVLFDEIEKAHPDVLNILLQIMDDGVLVDAKGRSFDFTHSIVILTSNLGTELVNKEAMGFSINPAVVGVPVTGNTSVLQSNDSISNEEKEKIQKILLDNLKQILKPELLNRFDDIIVFNKLGKGDTSKIFDVLLDQVKANFKEKDITLKVSKSAKEFVVKEGFSEEYGARSLRRAIEKHIVDGAVNKILENEDEEVSLIKIDYKNTLTFEIE